jgi:hypothetical protein
MGRTFAAGLSTIIGICLAWSSLGGGAKPVDSLVAQATISETGGKVHLAANDSRPLVQALDALQERYGWKIDYEDPEYISKLDYGESKASPAGDGPRRIPSGGAFVADLPAPSASNAQPDEQKTVQALVEAYNHSGNPGRFELRQDGEHLVVVGTAAHDAEGKISETKPLLDLMVNLPADERTVAETVDLVCLKISDKSPVKVSFGVHPFNLDRARITLAGGKELSARAYLENTITATGRRLCWRLLFDPESKSYVLDFHQLKLPAALNPANPAKP